MSYNWMRYRLGESQGNVYKRRRPGVWERLKDRLHGYRWRPYL